MGTPEPVPLCTSSTEMGPRFGSTAVPRPTRFSVGSSSGTRWKNDAASVVDGKTVDVLTFTDSDVLGGSLADGNYTLTICADCIRDAAGRRLDGDGDGRMGGDRVDRFFRLYGDSDGDRDVDLHDLNRFLSTFGRRQGDPHYLWYLDVNGDDRVGLIDLPAFVRRLGTHLNP